MFQSNFDRCKFFVIPTAACAAVLTFFIFTDECLIETIYRFKTDSALGFAWSARWQEFGFWENVFGATEGDRGPFSHFGGLIRLLGNLFLCSLAAFESRLFSQIGWSFCFLDLRLGFVPRIGSLLAFLEELVPLCLLSLTRMTSLKDAICVVLGWPWRSNLQFCLWPSYAEFTTSVVGCGQRVFVRE